MQDPRNLSWNQFNQARRFPLLFDCTAVSRDGHFAIPDDLFVGLYISYGLGGGFTDPGGFYIGEIVYWRTGLSISIFYQESRSETGEKVTETTVDLDSPPKTATLLGFDNRFFYGFLVFGTTTGLESQPAGEWQFDPDATRLDPFCVRATVPEVSALYVQDTGKTLGPFYGDITLSAGERIRLSVRSAEETLQCLEDAPTGTGTEVTIHGESDSGVENATPCVKTVNGVEPDENGNLTLLGRSCLEISGRSGEAAIVLDDQCAQPCCTCEELAPILERIATLSASISDFESRLQTLMLQAEFLAQSAAFIR